MEGRSSTYSSDVGKLLDIPVLHVNADSPEDVVKVCRMAVEYRQKFHGDIIIDLIGYRRHGHNELDEPAFTQPIMYRKIRSRLSVVQLYAKQLEREGVLTESQVNAIIEANNKKLDENFQLATVPPTHSSQHLLGRWKGFVLPKDITQPIDTGVERTHLVQFAQKSIEYPMSMSIHPRLQRSHVKARMEALGANQIDWSTAEAMAFASLLSEGFDIRLCGQDACRGTFSQRHAVLVDQETGAKHTPLASKWSPNFGKFQVVNSPLSELAVLGFEYGYSIEDPFTLVLWEAQFGDFANGAQLIIDLFIANGEELAVVIFFILGVCVL